MMGARVTPGTYSGRTLVDSSRLMVMAGSNTGSVSATEPDASKPALPARQSNTKLRCQFISYGVRMTVVCVEQGTMAPLGWSGDEFGRWF